MAQLFKGPYTAAIEGSFVVFIIGMRINKFWAIRHWWPVAWAMPRMLRALRAHPGQGLLHEEHYCYWRGIALVQYWRSYEHLERFANAPDTSHVQAWQKFNETVGDTDSVGIWHETYLVDPRHYECIYRNMPKKGLARAGTHLPLGIGMETARQRLGKSDSSTL